MEAVVSVDNPISNTGDGLGRILSKPAFDPDACKILNNRLQMIVI